MAHFRVAAAHLYVAKHGVAMHAGNSQNPKLEVRNSKQIRNGKFKGQNELAATQYSIAYFFAKRAKARRSCPAS